MQLDIATLSKPGGREVNEDACGVWSTADACYCVLSDGAGGHGGGDVASKLVVSEVLNWFHGQAEIGGDALAAALVAANRRVVEAQSSGTRLADMRATVVALALDTAGAQAVWGHMGDSRLYCFRRSRVLFQTRDHSIGQALVDTGYVKAEDLRSIPKRGTLLAALGDAHKCEPEIHRERFVFCDGDVFLLCSDGWWEYVAEGEMEQALLEAASSADWLRLQEEAIVRHGKPRQDNYSAISIWCTDPLERTRAGT